MKNRIQNRIATVATGFAIVVALFAAVNVINVKATVGCTFGITLTGSTNVSVAQNSTYTDAGATAVDSFCTDISSSITTTGLPVDTSVLGDHTITYNVGVSNPQNPDETIFATPVTRTVTVTFVPYATITSPVASSTVNNTIDLAATFYDNQEVNENGVDWAIRFNTCNAVQGVGVFGNVDGKNDPSTWDGHNFSATLDSSTTPEGDYCFVFHPRNATPDVRETRWFTISHKKVEQGTASITVIKQTGPEEFAKSIKDFTFDLSQEDVLIATSSANAGNGVNASFTGLVAGTYDLTEEQYDGWTLANSTENGRCVYDNESVGRAITNGERITLDDGDHVVCTFINIKGVNAISGGSGPVAPSAGGQVLGDSTSTVPASNGTPSTKPTENPAPSTGASCSAATIKGYIKFGAQNDPEDVKVLQKFLNDHQNAKLPITGFYGPLTRAALIKFQEAEAEAILKPWVDLGLLPNKENGTGYVFKTTQYRINTLLCPGSNIPAPILP